MTIQKLDIKENELAAFKESMQSHDVEKSKLLKINEDQSEQLRLLHEQLIEEKNERRVMEEAHDAEIRAREMARSEKARQEKEAKECS